MGRVAYPGLLYRPYFCRLLHPYSKLVMQAELI
jgi:hypothetical protein